MKESEMNGGGDDKTGQFRSYELTKLIANKKRERERAIEEVIRRRRRQHIETKKPLI